MAKAFSEKALCILRRIPRGRLSTYKEIAIALGNPNAARAVGNACNKNIFAPKVPCHRIVKSNGFIGDYSKGFAQKRVLLESEGIRIKNNKAVDFDRICLKARDLK